MIQMYENEDEELFYSLNLIVTIYYKLLNEYVTCFCLPLQLNEAIPLQTSFKNQINSLNELA